MPTAAVLLADGFEEVEAVTCIDVLRRAGVDVTVLGVTGAAVRGAHGVLVQVDAELRGMPGPWDALVLPGGMPGAARLRDDDRVQELLLRHEAARKVLAAICAAPIALARAGLLRGRQATCYPGFGPQLVGATVLDDPVVRDGRILTGRGPGLAMEFALALVGMLVGVEKAAELRERLLVP